MTRANRRRLMERKIVEQPPYPEALFPDPVDGRSLKASESDTELQKQRE